MKWPEVAAAWATAIVVVALMIGAVAASVRDQRRDVAECEEKGGIYVRSYRGGWACVKPNRG